MKRILFPAAALILTGAALCSCGKNEDDGKKAAGEFCDCFAAKLVSECEEEGLEACAEIQKEACFSQLKKDYSNYMTNSFIESFNEASTCGAELIKVEQ